MSCPNVPIRRFNNVNKSSQFIVGNPPIVPRLKSPQFWGPSIIRLSQRGRPQLGLVKSGISINRELVSLFNTHLIHTQVQRIVEEGDTGARQKEVTTVERSPYYFGALLLVLILSLRKLRGFLLYGFSEENICVHFLM